MLYYYIYYYRLFKNIQARTETYCKYLFSVVLKIYNTKKVFEYKIQKTFKIKYL